MAKRLTHHNCPLCRKKFTAKRHSVVKPYSPKITGVYRGREYVIGTDYTRTVIRKVITVCGHCKAKLKRGKLTRFHDWCDANFIGYRVDFIPSFDTDKHILHMIDAKKHPIKRVGRSASFKGRGNVKGVWIEKHNEAVRNRSNPEIQRQWHPNEIKEFNRMLQEERKARKAEEAEFAEELAQESSQAA
jgi:hypothetical protein